MSEAIITTSLELVGERAGDPTRQVYARIFADHPEMKDLFVLDKDDAAKGNMLAEFIDCILDLCGDKAYAKGLIQTEVINHDNLGVPREVFGTFLVTVRDVFKDILGADWTTEMDVAWQDLVTEFEDLLKVHAA